MSEEVGLASTVGVDVGVGVGVDAGVDCGVGAGVDCGVGVGVDSGVGVEVESALRLGETAFGDEQNRSKTTRAKPMAKNKVRIATYRREADLPRIGASQRERGIASPT